MNTAVAGQTPNAESARHFYLRQLQRLHDEAFELSEKDLPSVEYFPAFLQHVSDGTRAQACAIWLCSPTREVHLEAHLHGETIGLKAELGEQEPYLREVLKTARPLYVPPSERSSVFLILLAPILIANRIAGVVQVWTSKAEAPADSLTQFLSGMAHYASLHLRNCQLRSLNEQQLLCERLKHFTDRIHQSLDFPTVAYDIVNEGRTLIGCDRLSVIALQSRPMVQAVSGVDVIDRRSPQVKLLAALGQSAIAWGEPLIYRGVPDESLPSVVLSALDDYLAECACQLMVLLPLKPGAEFALVMECFEAGSPPGDLHGRLEVIGRPAASALANASRYRRIPLAGMWELFGKFEEQLYGRKGLRLAAIALIVAAVIGTLIYVPAPLKMDARGQLLPCERRWLYSPAEGRVVRFAAEVQPGNMVHKNQPMLLMHDTQLETKLLQLSNDISAAEDEIASLSVQQSAARSEADRMFFASERKQKEYVRQRKYGELQALRARTNSEPARPGYFWLRAPITGTILSWDSREQLTNRPIKPSDALVRIGDKSRGWEVEINIPCRQVGPILEALICDGSEALDVDLVPAAAPTRRFRGKLDAHQIGGAAGLETEGADDAVLRAIVRIDGPDIPAAQRVPPELLIAGAELRCRVRCGERSLGFTLFHGVWEFIAEKFLLF